MYSLTKNLGISLDLSYNLYGHSQPYSQSAAFSLIRSLAPDYIESLVRYGFNESAVGMMLPTHSLNPDCIYSSFL